MKRAFQVVIGFCIVLLVIMLSIFFRGSGTAESPVVAVQPTPPKPAAAVATKPKTKGHLPYRQEMPEAEAARETPEAPVITVEVEVPPPPFPTAADLRAGMTKDEMIGKFGYPRVAASWAQNGSLAEKLIYTRDSRVTAVILVDGEVVYAKNGDQRSTRGSVVGRPNGRR